MLERDAVLAPELPSLLNIPRDVGPGIRRVLMGKTS